MTPAAQQAGSEVRAAARRLRALVEPYHSLYLAPEGNGCYEAAGLKGGWMRYFAARSSPLGAVSAELVVSSFYGFHPRLVGRAIPAAWERSDPARVRSARVEAVDASVRQTKWSRVIEDPRTERATALMSRAMSEAAFVGRPLFAAHRALPAPDDPHLALWWQATLLREHRGDGHIAALVAEGVDPAESLVLHCATGELPREGLQPLRGWTDEEWDETTAALIDRGWLGADGALSPEGRSLRDYIESVTDTLAAEPWMRSIGQRGLQDAVEVLSGLLEG